MYRNIDKFNVNKFNIPNKEIIAIGDIHGNKESLVNILQHIGIIDKNENVIPKNNFILVQVGDIVDRGPQSLEALELMVKIQQQSQKGNVIRLLGNHEIMLLMNDHRFINTKTDTDDKLRKIKNILILDIFEGNIKTVYNIGDLVFSHAGITHDYLNKLQLTGKNIEIEEICAKINKYTIENISKNNINNLYDDDGIFWNRQNPYPIGKNFPSNYIQIIGHTPKYLININSYIIYIDIGMVFNNNDGYLSINNKKFRAIYL